SNNFNKKMTLSQEDQLNRLINFLFSFSRKCELIFQNYSVKNLSDKHDLGDYYKNCTNYLNSLVEKCKNYQIKNGGHVKIIPTRKPEILEDEFKGTRLKSLNYINDEIKIYDSLLNEIYDYSNKAENEFKEFKEFLTKELILPLNNWKQNTQETTAKFNKIFNHKNQKELSDFDEKKIF
ncbi:unnamed protein product, partial [Brachionus calyciflorus]